MGLHHTGTGETRAGAGAAGNGFVILVARVAESEVVHGALACRHHTKGAKQGVGNAARRLHIARDHRRRRVWIEHGTGRNDHPQRFQAARVERDIVIDQRAKNIQHGGHTHRGRGVEVVLELVRGAAEVDLGTALHVVDPDRNTNPCAVVQLQREGPIPQLVQNPAHRLLRVVLHMAHIGLDHVQPEFGDHLEQFLRAFFVGGNLGPQVGHVLLRIARRVFCPHAPRCAWFAAPRGDRTVLGRPGDGGTTEQRKHFGLAQHALRYQLDVVDLHALLLDMGRKRRHGPRRGASNIRMVAPAADVKQRLAFDVHRRDDRDIGQVCATVVGVVQDKNVTGAHAGCVLAHHGLDAFAHRTQVHRHVRGIGDQVAQRIEQRAAEIQPLLDVHRIGSVLQLQAHLFSDVHEQVVEYLEQDRVGAGTRCMAHRALHAPLQQQVIHGRQHRLPAGLDHGGGVALGNDGRAGNHIARAQVFTHHECRVVPGTVAIHTHGIAPWYRPRRMELPHRLVGSVTGQQRFDRHRLHHQRTALHQEGEALAIGSLKSGLHLGQITKRHQQSRVTALKAQMHTAAHLHHTGGVLLPAQFFLRCCGQLRQAGSHLGQRRRIQRQFDRLFTQHGLVGQSHAIGTQNARQGMHQYAGHTQRVCYQAGMLAGRAAETLQGVARYVITPRHGNLLDGIGHLLHGNADEALCQVVWGLAGL